MADPPAHRAGPVSRRRLLLFAALAPVALLLIGWVWFWHSGAGLRWALAHTPLRWQSAQGSLAGGARVEGVTWQSDGALLHVASLRLDVEPAALWRGQVRVRRLGLEGVDLRLPATAGTTPRGGGIHTPLPIRIEVLQANQVSIEREGRRFAIDEVHAGVELVQAQLRWQALRLAQRGWQLDSEGDLALDGSDVLHVRGSAQASDARWRLQGKIAYSKMQASLQLDGSAPQALHLELDAKRNGAAWQWRAAARSQGLDTRDFGLPGTLLRFDLHTVGNDLDLQIEGDLRGGDLHLVLPPSRMAWRDQALVLDPLALKMGDATLHTSGAVRFADRGPQAELEWALAGTPPGFAADTAMQLRGRLDGGIDDWRLQGDGDLRLPAVPTLRVTLDGEGDRERARLRQFRLRSTQGGARLTGDVRWTPALDVHLRGDLDRLDPRLWSPEFPGRVSADIDVRADQDGEAWHYDAHLSQLRGELRGRPLSGELHVRQAADGGQLQAVLGIGASRLRATAERRAGARAQGPWQWRLAAQPLQLADLHPDARGALDGHLAGSDDWPREGELHGADLHFAEVSLGRADLRIQAAPGERRRVELHGADLATGGAHLAHIQLAGDGDRNSLHWTLNADAGIGQVMAAGQWRTPGRVLRVEQLALTSTDFGRWNLRQPGRFTFAPLRLPNETCLDAEHGASLCAGGRWPEHLRLHARAFELAMLSAALDPQASGVVLAGRFDADLDARYTGGNWQGAFDARLGAGQLGLQPAHGSPVFTWRQARLHGQRSGERLRFDFDAATGSEGRVRAALDTGLDAQAPLGGFVELDLHQLAWLELLSPDLARPSGRIHGRVDLRGTRAAPVGSGEWLLDDFQAELPALGIRVRESQARVQAGSDGRFQLAARLASGDGVLAIDGGGRLWPAPSVDLAVTGTRVRLVDNPELRAWISPALVVRGDATQIAVRGALDLPEAHIALDKLQPQASARSPDVQVIDPVDAGTRSADIPLLIDLRLRPGEKVALKGFGLDGKLGGELHITQLPGREPLGAGSLTLSGQFQRYGKPLQISHARLIYAGTPLVDPALDIRAERKLDGQMVGVQLSGRASRAQTELIAEPALAQSEILSYLVLGRPLRAASADEGARLDAAAMALGAGGNLLAGQIGTRIGLDDAGIAESRILGANTLTVGKYLSPRLYLSYGVSLLGAGQILSLKYLLGAGVDVELESGLESRASLNWRMER